MAASIDIEKPDELKEYLRAAGRIHLTESVEMQVLPGGVSNRTVLVRRESGEAWVIKQALAKLRVKVDWFSDPSRIEREALGLKWLAQLAPPGTITPLIFEDPANHLLAMEAVAEPHENWKTILLRGDVQEDHVRQFASLLGQVHRKGWERRDELAAIFDERSFFESLRLEPYYLYTAQQESRAREFLESLVNETRAMRLSIVHGDYSPKNILVHDGRLVLLDHEVIHWGDPAFDVGFALTHLLSKAHHLPQHRHRFREAAILFWNVYFAAIKSTPWASGIDARAARHMLACLLARVAGRSPLEYLDEIERLRQRQATIEIATQNQSMELQAIIDKFIHSIQKNG